jgi:hypothetical protein
LGIRETLKAPSTTGTLRLKPCKMVKLSADKKVSGFEIVRLPDVTGTPSGVKITSWTVVKKGTGIGVKLLSVRC